MTHLVEFSDVPFTQYRNGRCLKNICCDLTETFNIYVDKCYFAPHHATGEQDQIIATVKSEIRKAVKADTFLPDGKAIVSFLKKEFTEAKKKDAKNDFRRPRRHGVERKRCCHFCQHVGVYIRFTLEQPMRNFLANLLQIF